MELNKTKITTADRFFYSLCDEIDYLKEEVKYWKQRYETEVNERNEEWKERKEQSSKDITNTLLFALSISDDANGNLVIKKEDRIELAKSWH